MRFILNFLVLFIFSLSLLLLIDDGAHYIQKGEMTFAAFDTHFMAINNALGLFYEAWIQRGSMVSKGIKLIFSLIDWLLLALFAMALTLITRQKTYENYF